MKKEDIEFLKELQNELKTQNTYGQADPRYWVIMENKDVVVADGCGDDVRFYFPDVCDESLTMDEVVEYINEYYYEDMSDEQKEEWDDMAQDIHNFTSWEVKNFLEFNDIISNIVVVEVEKQDVISQETGCFLTFRAAKEYLDKFGYNHTNARPYAMTAYRNFELERLLNIIKTSDFDKISVE